MKKIILITLLSLFIPFLMFHLFITEREIQFHFEDGYKIRIKKQNKEIEEVPFEEYIVGVVAGEMPVTFEKEALKSQAVAARSYVLTKKEENKEKDYDVVDTVMNQVYVDPETLKQKWGDDYVQNINKIKTAVLETKGEYLAYQNTIAEALFFSTSSGKTENVEEVFSEKLPYLRSVDSSFDEEVSPVYTDSKTFSKEEFYQKLSLEKKEKLDIQILKTTSTGRIKEIKINEKTFSGNDVASKLSLRSSFFSITETNENIRVDTKGYGHGVGMSQYGAEALAKKGYTYDQILKYYYTGIEIKKIENKV